MLFVLKSITERNFNMQSNVLKVYMSIESILENKWTQRAFFFALCFFLFDSCFAGVEGDMKASVEELQKDLLGNGWATVGKIAAFTLGCVMSIAHSSGVPFATGIGVGAGIHFVQKYTATAAGCII